MGLLAHGDWVLHLCESQKESHVPEGHQNKTGNRQTEHTRNKENHTYALWDYH